MNAEILRWTMDCHSTREALSVIILLGFGVRGHCGWVLQLKPTCLR